MLNVLSTFATECPKGRKEKCSRASWRQTCRQKTFTLIGCGAWQTVSRQTWPSSRTSAGVPIWLRGARTLTVNRHILILSGQSNTKPSPLFLWCVQCSSSGVIYWCQKKSLLRVSTFKSSWNLKFPSAEMRLHYTPSNTNVASIWQYFHLPWGLLLIGPCELWRALRVDSHKKKECGCTLVVGVRVGPPPRVHTVRGSGGGGGGRRGRRREFARGGRRSFLQFHGRFAVGLCTDSKSHALRHRFSLSLSINLSNHFFNYFHPSFRTVSDMICFAAKLDWHMCKIYTIITPLSSPILQSHNQVSFLFLLLLLVSPHVWMLYLQIV